MQKDCLTHIVQAAIWKDLEWPLWTDQGINCMHAACNEIMHACMYVPKNKDSSFILQFPAIQLLPLGDSQESSWGCTQKGVDKLYKQKRTEKNQDGTLFSSPFEILPYWQQSQNGIHNFTCKLLKEFEMWGESVGMQRDRISIDIIKP